MTLGPFKEVTIFGNLESILCVLFIEWRRSQQYSNLICVSIFPLIEDDNIKEILAKESGLPDENVEFAKVNQLYFFLNGTSPHQNISILDVQTSLLWNGNPTTCNDFPLNSAQDGAMFFYRFVKNG